MPQKTGPSTDSKEDPSPTAEETTISDPGIDSAIAALSTTSTANTKVFRVEILPLIRGAQQQHGLRHGDYQRYRIYCGRRIRRLRKSLNYLQGDRRHFKRRDITLNQLEGKNGDVRFIYIVLMNVERAWSYAMQLRQEANSEPRKKFHMINRLRRACTHVIQLQQLCNSDLFDARTKLECDAYYAWIHGTLHFELQLWKSAGEYLKRAQMIYEKLANALNEDERELYRAKVTEFAPNLRYCIYNMSGDNNTSKKLDNILEMRAQGVLQNLDALIHQTRLENTEGKQVVEWRKRNIVIRSEKVRLFLISLEELDKRLPDTKNIDQKIQLLEHCLIDCKDAIQAVKDDVKQDTKLRSLTTGQPVTGVQYLIAYLSYIRYCRTIQRNLCLVEQAKLSFDDPNHKIESENNTDVKRVRPQDLARLYEIILQNITDMQQINGMEDDKLYQDEINNLSLAFKAFRCYYIALTLIDMRKWKEAVALYVRSSNYAKEYMQTTPIKEFDMSKELNQLIKTINGCKFSAHAYSVLESDVNDNTNRKSTDLFKLDKISLSKPVFEQLLEYRANSSLNTKNPNIFKLLPEMQPIPCKPLFFDLAYNYIDFPPLTDKIKSTEKKGISGFVKGILGWGNPN